MKKQNYRDAYERFLKIDLHTIKTLASCKTKEQCDNCFQWCLDLIRRLKQYCIDQYNECYIAKYRYLWQSLVSDLDQSINYYKIAYKLQLQQIYDRQF